MSKEQVVQLAKSPKQRIEVEMGRKYESRLRLFTEPKFKEEIKEESAWEEFRTFMKKALSEEKDIRISDFIQYPLSSVNITESLMSDLYKVFDAGNSYFSIDTVKKNGGEELNKIYSRINLNDWIEETGKRVLKNKPNTVVVIDKDEDGYPYLLDIDNERLIDIELKEDGVRCEYVVFTHSIKKDERGEEEKRISVYDDDNYNVVLLKGGEYSIETSVRHKAKLCPARMFLSERLNSNTMFSRKSPLALALSKIQEWQYFDIYKFYTDHYAPFPVTEMVRAKCGHPNCSNGTIYTEDTYYANGESKTRTIASKCTTCASNNQVGVGAKILIDPTEEGESSASGKFRMISNSTENLKYLQEKLDGIEEYIKLKVVGIDNILSKEAINEKQAQGSFESRTNVLLGLKSNLDGLYEWIARTVADLRGGKPVTVNANFGTEWYLVSEDELQDRFKKAIETGLPRAEVNEIYHQLIETKYKGNPDKIERLKLINKINPCQYDTFEQKTAKKSAGLISEQELIISERLSIFVQRFEQENGSIVDFGSELESREKKIEILVQTINRYADEYRSANTATEPVGGS